MKLPVRIGLVFASFLSFMAEGTSALEKYRNLLEQAVPYSVAPPAEVQHPGRRMPRMVGVVTKSSGPDPYSVSAQAYSRWVQEKQQWEVAAFEHWTRELNRLVASHSSFVQMLRELGVRQTLRLLLESQYFVRPHPEVPCSGPDPRIVFKEAMKEFGLLTPTEGYAVEGIMASSELVEPQFALLPFVEGLLLSENMARVFESANELPGLTQALLSSGKLLKGDRLKFGESLLFRTKTPEAFLVHLKSERLLAGSQWRAVVEKNLPDVKVFQHFLALAPTEAQWARFLDLWPASRALDTLKSARIWVGLPSRWKLRVRSCLDSLAAPI
jgi:hypothetical protein